MECNEFKRESVFFSHEAIEKFGGSVTNGMKKSGKRAGIEKSAHGEYEDD